MIRPVTKAGDLTYPHKQRQQGQDLNQYNIFTITYKQKQQEQELP